MTSACQRFFLNGVTEKWQAYVDGEMMPAEFRDWYNEAAHYRPQVLSLDPSGIIEAFDSFEEYVDAIIAYTQRKLTKLETGTFGS